MNKFKKVLAILGIIVLLGSVLAISLTLIFSKSMSDTLFRGLVSLLVAIPIVAYGYVLLLRFATRTKNDLINNSELDDTSKDMK